MKKTLQRINEDLLKHRKDQMGLTNWSERKRFHELLPRYEVKLSRTKHIRYDRALKNH